MALSDYDKQLLNQNQQNQIQDLTNQWNELDKKHVALRDQETALRNSGDIAGADAIRSQINDIKTQKSNLNTQAEGIRASEGYLGGQSGTGYTQVAVKKTTVTPTVTDNSAYIQQMNEAKKKAALASIEDAYKKNVAAIDRAGVGLAESYQGARNQTAGASELAKRNNAEYAAAYGLNSGTGGQMELARNVTLQNNLNTINAQEAQSSADLAMQRANAEAEYNNAIAQAEQQGNYELAASLYQEKVRVQETLLQLQQNQVAMDYQAYRDSVNDAQQNWQNLFTQTKYDEGKTAESNATLKSYGELFLKQGVMPTAEMLAAMGMTSADANAYISAVKSAETTTTDKNTLVSYGNAFLEQGVMPSTEMLAAMGITQADAQAYINAVNAANINKASTTTATEPTMTLATAKDLAANGSFNEQVINVLNENGYDNNAIYKKYGYDPNDFYRQQELANSIPSDIKEMLMRNFPGGYITGANRWQSWVDKYGEDAMRAAGFSYGVDSSVLSFARYLYESTKNADYVVKKMRESGYSDTDIDAAMSQLGL